MNFQEEGENMLENNVSWILWKEQESHRKKGNFDRFLEWIVQGFGNGNGKVSLEHGILRRRPNK